MLECVGHFFAYVVVYEFLRISGFKPGVMPQHAGALPTYPPIRLSEHLVPTYPYIHLQEYLQEFQPSGQALIQDFFFFFSLQYYYLKYSVQILE